MSVRCTWRSIDPPRFDSTKNAEHEKIQGNVSIMECESFGKYIILENESGSVAEVAFSKMVALPRRYHLGYLRLPNHPYHRWNYGDQIHHPERHRSGTAPKIDGESILLASGYLLPNWFRSTLAAAAAFIATIRLSSTVRPHGDRALLWLPPCSTGKLLFYRSGTHDNIFSHGVERAVFTQNFHAHSHAH